MSDSKAEAAWARAREELPQTLERLKSYLRVPSISCEPEHAGDVARLCEIVGRDLGAAGFETRVLRLEGAHPVVSASRLRAGAERPTLLIYGHLDVQPVKGEAWTTPPHEPSVRDGRLYARGSSDDMGGWVSHLAALSAWLDTEGELPLNVRLVIEGEEEIGSPNLERYMDAFPEAFSADVMVLTDCENPSEDVPGLTTSLRGLYEVELHCEALRSDAHSGMWGNMLPDPGNALVKLLSRLLDDDGRMTVGRVSVDAAWRESSRALPLGPDELSRIAPLAPGVAPLPERDRSAAEWLWRQPAVTVLSTTLPAPGEHKNAIRPRATATLSVRLAPGQTREQMRALLEPVLLEDPPAGVRVSLRERPGGAESWLYEPRGPAFEAAERAYAAAWGHGLIEVGAGGSIPFVALFGRRYSHLPLILNGVLDPRSGLHGPDESLSLAVFEKAVHANVRLYAELAELGSKLGAP
ncbi:MAG TPA: M20/M25/M40 family metallo-hydrolase [Polyangiaceae bacterium]|jgi:acetylornithine deacetylase/succinyl-diaminopimelate desuccinylase-like protein